MFRQQPLTTSELPSPSRLTFSSTCNWIAILRVSPTYLRIVHCYAIWICAQRSSVHYGEFRVDCCGSSITPRSHQIPMMSISNRQVLDRSEVEMPGSLRLEPVRIFSLETPYSTPFRRDRRSMRLGKTMAIAYIHSSSTHNYAP